MRQVLGTPIHARCAFRFNAPRAGARGHPETDARRGRAARDAGVVYARCAGADEFYQRADEYPEGHCPHSVELSPLSPTKLPKGRRVPLKGSAPTLSAITCPLHFPAVMGRSARVCVLDPAELYARTACMHAYFVWVLYEYVLDLADDCPVCVCLALWQRVGPVGVAGYYPSTPLTGPCGPGISVWQRWPRDVAEPCMPAEGCGSRALLRFLR